MKPISRRRYLHWSMAALCVPKPSLALGRKPLGGELRLSLPWATERLDPHDLNDPLAAFVGHAVFEPLFARDDAGRVYPTLAQHLPEQRDDSSIVRLRPKLRSSSGAPLGADDLLWSLRRSRRLGGAALLLNFGAPEAVRGEPLVVRFPRSRASDLAEALSSPLTALVSRKSTPQRPDACGAFAASLGKELTLSRNLNAARGPSYLEQVTCTQAGSIASALRDFEVGSADVGWLGRGLHRARADSKLSSLGKVGWVVLRSGREAGAWSAPGAAAQLLGSVQPEQLARFGLKPMAAGFTHSAYGGPPCELLVRRDSSYLEELGLALSALLSRSATQITLRRVELAELRERKKQGDYGFLLDVVRSPGGPPRAEQLSLLSEVSQRLVLKAPNIEVGAQAILQMTRTLPLGIVGELELRVALTGQFAELQNWQLGNVWKPAS